MDIRRGPWLTVAELPSSPTHIPVWHNTDKSPVTWEVYFVTDQPTVASPRTGFVVDISNSTDFTLCVAGCGVGDACRAQSVYVQDRLHDGVQTNLVDGFQAEDATWDRGILQDFGRSILADGVTVLVDRHALAFGWEVPYSATNLSLVRDVVYWFRVSSVSAAGISATSVTFDFSLQSMSPRTPSTDGKSVITMMGRGFGILQKLRQYEMFVGSTRCNLSVRRGGGGAV